MSFLYWLEGIRTPFLDKFFSIITNLGSEMLFLAAAIIVFWCVSKKNGYYLLTVGFFGTLISQLLKIVCRVPRPWVKDPEFTIVESAREEAAGYSFPSGHTQNAVTVFGCPARFTKNGIIRILCVGLMLLVAFSRMYLGVHTPADVLVGLVIGVILVFALYPIFQKGEKDPRYIYAVMTAIVVCAAAFVLFLEIYNWPEDVDGKNLAEAVKNGYLLFGCSIAMVISFFIDRRWIKFEVSAPWWAQVLKVVLGLIIVLAIKEGLKPVMEVIFGGHIAGTAIRYFLMVIFAAAVWPLTFKWFSKGCPIKKHR